MTISIFEFQNTDPYSGEPLWPAFRRTAGHALSNTYLRLCETGSIAAFIISNDDGTTGARVRVGTASSGEDATQADVYIGPNSTRTFYVTRKDRGLTTATANAIYINAVADS